MISLTSTTVFGLVFAVEKPLTCTCVGHAQFRTKRKNSLKPQTNLLADCRIISGLAHTKSNTMHVNVLFFARARELVGDTYVGTSREPERTTWKSSNCRLNWDVRLMWDHASLRSDERCNENLLLYESPNILYVFCFLCSDIVLPSYADLSCFFERYWNCYFKGDNGRSSVWKKLTSTTSKEFLFFCLALYMWDQSCLPLWMLEDVGPDSEISRMSFAPSYFPLCCIKCASCWYFTLREALFIRISDVIVYIQFKVLYSCMHTTVPQGNTVVPEYLLRKANSTICLDDQGYQDGAEGRSEHKRSCECSGGKVPQVEGYDSQDCFGREPRVCHWCAGATWPRRSSPYPPYQWGLVQSSNCVNKNIVFIKKY